MGHTLGLFAAGVALLALLIASYTRRSTWITLGSMAMSAAIFVGLLFFATVHEPGQVRARLAWIANQLSLVADPQIANELKSAVASITPSCEGSERPECQAAAGAEPPAPIEAKPVQAAAATHWFGTNQDPEPAPKATSQSPVAWNLDDRDARGPVTSPWGFSIGGTNVSDEALDQVQAVLKPDSTGHEMPLALSVDGEDASLIPAAARFSLFFATPDGGASGQIGGAILTFRYVRAGQRRTSILYLTPSMVARFANR